MNSEGADGQEMENSGANAATFSRDPMQSPLSEKGEQSRGLHSLTNNTGSSGHYVGRTRRKPAQSHAFDVQKSLATVTFAG
jgi:hypothetical protein